jgi:ABC-type glycerol-3-phosphate transport system substrate-binding protein
MMRKHVWLALLLLPGACGEETTPPPAGDQPVTIKYLRHDNPPYAKADDEFLVDYKKTKPNVTVEVTTVRYPTLTSTLLAELKTDKLTADLVIVPPSWVCGFADNVLDVPDDVITLTGAQAAYFPAPLSGSVCNGKLKGLPTEYNLEYGGVVVNMTKYQEKYGAGSKPSWQSWADFITTAAALTEYENGMPRANGLDIDNGWPQPVKHIFLSLILQNGGKYWDGTGEAFDASKGHTFNFTNEAAIKALTSMVDWVANKKVMFPKELVPAMNTFVTVRLASGAAGYGWNDPAKPLSVMGYAGTWALANTVGQLAATNQTKYDFVALPPMEGSDHKFVQNSGFAFVVPKTSKNAKTAWAIAKAMALSPEAMRKWAATAGSLPALKVNGTPEMAAMDPQLTKVQPLLAKGQWVGYIPSAGLETIEGILVSNYFDAVKGEANGGKTIMKALQDMQSAANGELAKYR